MEDGMIKKILLFMCILVLGSCASISRVEEVESQISALKKKYQSLASVNDHLERKNQKLQDAIKLLNEKTKENRYRLRKNKRKNMSNFDNLNIEIQKLQENISKIEFISNNSIFEVHNWLQILNEREKVTEQYLLKIKNALSMFNDSEALLPIPKMNTYHFLFPKHSNFFSEKTVDPLYIGESMVIKKVIAKTDTVYARYERFSDYKAFKLKPLQPYYVLSEDDNVYEITDNIRLYKGTIGFVRKKYVYEWNTSAGLALDIFSINDGATIKVWLQKKAVKKSLLFPMKIQKADFTAKLNKTHFNSISNQSKFHKLPVLDIDSITTHNGEKKCIYKILFPVLIKSSEWSDSKRESFSYLEDNRVNDKYEHIIPLNCKNLFYIDLITNKIKRKGLHPFNIVICEGWVINQKDLYNRQILMQKEGLEKICGILMALSDTMLNRNNLCQKLTDTLNTNNPRKIKLTSESDLQRILDKKFGIIFNNNLFPFNVDFVLQLGSKRELFTKRIRIANRRIHEYIDEKKKRLFDHGQLWVPISLFDLPKENKL